MRKLHAKGVALTAEVRPDNCEVPGNVHSVDASVAAKIDELVTTDPAAAAELIENHDWHPAGLSADEIVAMFAWAVPQVGGGFPADSAAGWCKGPEWHWDAVTEGSDCMKTAAKRFQRVADWVEQLRDTLPADDVCICITHGGMQDRLVNQRAAPPAVSTPANRRVPKTISLPLLSGLLCTICSPEQCQVRPRC